MHGCGPTTIQHRHGTQLQQVTWSHACEAVSALRCPYGGCFIHVPVAFFWLQQALSAVKGTDTGAAECTWLVTACMAEGVTGGCQAGGQVETGQAGMGGRR